MKLTVHGSRVAGIVVVQVLLMLISSMARGADHTLYVSPLGNDRNPGTLKKPFRSLVRARDEVRKINQYMDGDIVVFLRGGVYPLSETIVFDQRDGGFNGHQVVYRSYGDEQPVISGGVEVSGWKKNGDGQISATVNEKGFRQLYVNGHRAVRAREPEVGQYDRTKIWDYTTRSLMINSDLVGQWEDLKNVEMILQMWWTDYVLRLDSVNTPEIKLQFDWMPKYSKLKFREPEQTQLFEHMFPPKIDGHAFHFENARAFLDTVNEWYQDPQTGELLYNIPEGTDPAGLSVIIPNLETLVKVRGTAGKPVRNLSFEGIRFYYTTWNEPTDSGHIGTQAGQYAVSTPGSHGHPPAALEISYARNVSVSKSIFRNLGATAIDLPAGDSAVKITGNLVCDVSGNGISVGQFSTDDWVKTDTSVYPADPEIICRNNVISDNYVTRTGRDYYGTIGIVCGFAGNMTIEHNEIWDIPYTGISVGWGWTPRRSPLQNNTIRNNHIHDVLTLLCDGGGIYTQSNQPGGMVKENYIHDIQLSEWALGTINSGIYLDEYSNGITVEMNLLENIMDDPIYFIKRNTTLELTFIKNELWYKRFTEDHIRVKTTAGPRQEYRLLWRDQLSR